MVIRIAICDDELYICSQLETMLKDILEYKNLQYEIEVFESGENLCREMERNAYDLIFLDIELPKISGIDVGRHIRDILENEIVQIVYISGKDGYAMELFEFRPMNFLVKPLERERLNKVIEKYMIVTGQNHQIFQYKKRTKHFKIPMSEILYFEKQNRKVLLCTKDYEDVFYDSFEGIYKMVKSMDFLLIHSSIIVNYRFIKKMGYNEVTMTNGKILTISQSKRREVKAMYMELRKRER